MTERIWKWYPVPVFRRHEGRLQQWHWGTDYLHAVIMPSMTREEWLAFVPPAGIKLEWRDVTVVGDLVDQSEYRSLQRAAADLLTYIDDHDWGTIPEGVTADKLRDMVHTHAVEKMALFPDCPGCEAIRAASEQHDGRT